MASWMFLTLFVTMFHMVLSDGMSSQTHKCNCTVIAAIEEYWSVHGFPNDIMGHLKNQSVLNFIWTTCGYYEDEDDILCISGIYADNGNTIINQYKNSSLIADRVNHFEGKGFLQDASNDKRYMVILGRTSAWYKCSDNGPEGAPQGGIHVACGYEEEDVECAKEVLASLGMPQTVQFGTGCNPCLHACPAPPHHDDDDCREERPPHHDDECPPPLFSEEDMPMF